ncbi:hypothetical protein AXF42_Ash011954 [Apostasia shenzhenica]|uniref:Uncharacterized protein n=1 Tax=Apostasia shenzhenica TaxID=1088818 RepID=A0A2I0AWC1_9ASPA|nr:hypothetical protein AXF42_Ash011954 [Apostasia shenzhenica]
MNLSSLTQMIVMKMELAMVEVLLEILRVFLLKLSLKSSKLTMLSWLKSKLAYMVLLFVLIWA